MFLIGLASVLVSVYGILRAVYTGRIENIFILLWSAPLLGMVCFSSYYVIVNGLVVITGIAMMVLVIYSLTGYVMWDVSVQNKNHVAQAVIFVLMLVISIYFYYQCFCNGYLDFFLSKYMQFLSVFILSSVSSFLMNGILMTAVDKYFSKKGTFIIIKCSPVKNIFSSSAIKGVRNGIAYRLYAENLYFSLLKNEKSLKLSVKNGIFGGVYVLNDGLLNGHDRKKRRIKKLLRNKTLFAFLAVMLIVLLVFKLKMRVGFEEIIVIIINAILGKKL
jgi:hypothetical protein